MAKLIMTQGLPGSGKSTWAKQFVKDNPNTKRVSRDDLRRMLYGGEAWSEENEALVTACQTEIIWTTHGMGFDLIVDETFANKKHFDDFIEAWYSEWDIEVRKFGTSYDICLRRNQARTGTEKVPEHVIQLMYRKLIRDFPDFPWDNNE